MPTFALLIALAAAPVEGSAPAPPPAPRAIVASAVARAEIVTLEPVRPLPARGDRAQLQRDVDPSTGTIEFY